MITLLIIASLIGIGTINCLDVSVGLIDCPTCTNYYQVITADALPVLQKAANAVGTAGGGTMTILPGTYTLCKYIDFSSNTNVIGAGIDITTFKLVDFAAPWRVGTSSKAGFFRSSYQKVKSCHDLSFIGFTLDGNKANQNIDPDSEYGRYGMFTEGCTNVLMDTIRVKNFQGYGFDPHGWKTGGVYGKNLTIKNCISNDNNWDGFTLDQTDTIIFTNNLAANNGRHGVNVVTGSFNVILSDTKTINNGYSDPHGGTGCGIMIQNNQLFGTNNVVAKNSVLTGDKKGGICTDDVYDINMDSNIITTPTYCVLLTNSNGITINNNNCNSVKKIFINNVNSTGITDTNNVLSWVVPPSPPPVPVPDPTCSNGIKAGKYCCLASCGSCGGVNCGIRIGKSAGCCTGSIQTSGKLCSVYSSPCIIG
jgi:hypothetical protein